MNTTIKDFLYTVGSLSYDNSDYRVIKSGFREKQIAGFVDTFVAGTEIVMNGSNGLPLLLKGLANEDMGATGKEEIFLSGYQIYDYSDTDGHWYVVSFPSKEKVEEFLLSEAGYLNFYSTQMFVFLDGEVQYFEIMFNGNGGSVVSIDKDQFDMPMDVSAMKDKIWVKWLSSEEVAPLTDEDVAAFLKSLKEKEENDIK